MKTTFEASPCCLLRVFVLRDQQTAEVDKYRQVGYGFNAAVGLASQELGAGNRKSDSQKATAAWSGWALCCSPTNSNAVNSVSHLASRQ